MLLATFPNFVQKIIWSFSSAQPSSHFNLASRCQEPVEGSQSVEQLKAKQVRVGCEASGHVSFAPRNGQGSGFKPQNLRKKKGCPKVISHMACWKMPPLI